MPNDRNGRENNEELFATKRKERRDSAVVIEFNRVWSGLAGGAIGVIGPMSAVRDTSGRQIRNAQLLYGIFAARSSVVTRTHA